jgi:hypothetical protein
MDEAKFSLELLRTRLMNEIREDLASSKDEALSLRKGSV